MSCLKTFYTYFVVLDLSRFPCLSAWSCHSVHCTFTPLFPKGFLHAFHGPLYAFITNIYHFKNIQKLKSRICTERKHTTAAFPSPGWKITLLCNFSSICFHNNIMISRFSRLNSILLCTHAIFSLFTHLFVGDSRLAPFLNYFKWHSNKWIWRHSHGRTSILMCIMAAQVNIPSSSE